MQQGQLRVLPYCEVPTLQSLDFRETSQFLRHPKVEAVQILRPPLAETVFAPLVKAFVAAPPFMSDFSRADPEIAFDLLADRLLGPSTFAAERKALISEMRQLERFARLLIEGPRLLISLRNWFAPGDLVWHVDRSRRRDALRILWPLGRAEGMRVTPAANIDPALYAAYMRREHPLLCRLDRNVAITGSVLERLWAHRPCQVTSMILDRFPFTVDPGRTWEIHRDAVSIHRIETPAHGGTFHRSAWANRSRPGLQIIMTATSG